MRSSEAMDVGIFRVQSISGTDRDQLKAGSVHLLTRRGLSESILMQSSVGHRWTFATPSTRQQELLCEDRVAPY